MNLNKLNCMFAITIENLKNLIYHIFLKKTLSLSIVYSKFSHEYEQIFKDEEWIEVLKILALINNIEEHNRIYNNVWRKYKSRI